MAVTLSRDKFKIFQFRPQVSISHSFSLHYLELKIAAFHRNFNCSTVQLFDVKDLLIEFQVPMLRTSKTGGNDMESPQSTTPLLFHFSFKSSTG